MDVNEAFSGVAVPLLETKVANGASDAVMFDAGLACLGIPLIPIHGHSLDISFPVAILLAHLAYCRWLVG